MGTSLKVLSLFSPNKSPPPRSSATADNENQQSANFNYVHWIVPTLAGVFLSASMLLIFVSFLNCKRPLSADE
jgi:hypothetical protein